MDLGRLLLISALAATLIGCSSASQQTHQSFADRGLYQTHQEQSPQMHSKRHVLPGRTVAAKSRHRKNNDSTKIAKSHLVPSFIRLHDRSNTEITTPPIAAKMETPSSSQSHDESVTPTVAAKTEIPPSSLLDDESVIKKTKATIAAKMSDLASVATAHDGLGTAHGPQNSGGSGILLNLKRWSGPSAKMRSATLLTPFVATSGTKTACANYFYISSKTTRRTSAATL
jgi:hypothetical protein